MIEFLDQLTRLGSTPMSPWLMIVARILTVFTLALTAHVTHRAYRTEMNWRHWLKLAGLLLAAVSLADSAVITGRTMNPPPLYQMGVLLGMLLWALADLAHGGKRRIRNRRGQ